MLTRIYGTAFEKREELAAYLEMLKQAKERDHNKLGRELKYFTTSDVVGQGLPLLLPKGAKVMQTLIRFVEDEEEKRGYQCARTPLMAKATSIRFPGTGTIIRTACSYWEMREKDSEVLALRPMECPFHFIIYNSDIHSYRELPIRYCETATLFRNESSGEMHGLIRVRQFTLADAHIVCTPDQVADEFKVCSVLSSM